VEDAVLARLACGGTPAIAFVVMVGGLAMYDVVGPPPIDAVHGAADRIDVGRPTADPDPSRTGDIPSGDGLVEGTDWSLIDPDRGVLHWSCDDEIPVQLVGPAPEGAAQALKSVAAELAAISGLGLVVPPAEPKWSDDQWRDGEILVRYINPDERQAPGIAFNDEAAIGRGGPISSGQAITAGNLVIRTDEPYFSSTDPTTPLGQAVLLHELGHTIGAGHSHDGEGVMTPSRADTDPSPGDKYVFRLLGCPQ
jgi:hypothetical protein